MDNQSGDKGLDCQGYIANTCSINIIQPGFSLVVDSVIEVLTSAFPEQIHSIYLYGSVARGTAVVGKSDLDVSVIFEEPLTVARLEALADISRTLPLSYSEISKLDIDPGHLAEVLDPKEQYRWQFWLKHCCCCIWGYGLSSRFEKCRPDARISYQMNQDLATFLKDMDGKFAQMSPDEVGKVIGKKILRTAYLLVAAKDNSWHTNLTKCAEVCLKYYPKNQDDIQLALKLSLGTLASRQQGIAMFNGFGQKLVKLLSDDADL